MESKWVPGAIWGPKIPKKKKSDKKRLDLVWIWPPFGLHFSTWKHFFRCQFLMFFGKYIFRTLGDFWKPKVPKRLPKWSQNGAQRKPGGTPWEVRKPWYLLYGRHMRETRGGSGRQLFPDCVSRSSLESSPGNICTDFDVFRCPGGTIEAPFEATSGTWIPGLKKRAPRHAKLEGPAAGAESV